MADNHEDLVSEFCGISGASPEQATQYLQAHDWDLSSATTSYFQDEEEGGSSTAAAAEPEYTGPRTLDGRPAPESASRVPASRVPASSTQQPKRKGIATLGSLGGRSQTPNQNDDDSDEDSEDEGRGNLFAGGEKSGLAVQDPNDGRPRKVVDDILAKARANSSRPDTDAEEAEQPNRFLGTGMTLGGDGVESRSIPDPHAARRQLAEPQERILHLWEDGFSIDDGDLRRFDDPANQEDLRMIRSGRAPLHLMNVQHDQAVDLKVHQHDGPYTEQPKKYKPFAGEGNRLGSPVPGASSTAPPPPAAAAAATSSSSAGPAIDESKPTLMLRIQLPDGTKLPARFNTTSTIGDVYAFVRSASTDTRSRAWALTTMFPNKQHTDESLVLGEMAEFKKGGTAVVKWT